MNDREAVSETVRGERAESSVARARSVQSRVSTFLALGLMSALGLGMLTWYYANTLSRRSHVRESAVAAAAHRAQGDLPLPSLGRIDPPVEPLPIAGPPPAVSPAVMAAEPGAPPGPYGIPPAKSQGQLALERRLSGAAFASQNNAVGAPPPGGGNPAPAGGVPDAADPSQAPLLGITAAVRAQVLPTQRLLLAKGAFIDCTLETAIDSTLPGITTCITATDTFGVDGKVVLMERGTKLVGDTKGQVQQGAARVFVIWNEARTPTGVIVPLASPGADELGRAGLPGEVNRHFWERFGAAMLVSVIDGAVQAAVQSSNNGNGAVIVNPSASQGVITEVLKNTVNIPPTVVKSQGDRVQVIVARDLDFRSVYALRSETAGRAHVP